MVVFKSGCIRARRLYSGKMVAFGRKRLNSGRSDCIPGKWLYSVKRGCN